MPKRVDYRRCKHCGGTPDEVGQISARGRCATCGDTRYLENVSQLRAKRGPFFEAWYEALHLAFEHSRR